MTDNPVMKVYAVRRSVRARLVDTAVWAVACAAVVGGALGVVELAFGDADTSFPALRAAVGTVATVVFVLAGVVLLGVLVAYVAVKLGAGRRKWEAVDRWVDEATNREPGGDSTTSR